MVFLMEKRLLEWMIWGGIYPYFWKHPNKGSTSFHGFFRSQLKEAIYEGHLHTAVMNNLPPRALETNRNSSNC